jgi:hypothetical protein
MAESVSREIGKLRHSYHASTCASASLYRLQVVDGLMDSWDGSDPQSFKKRLFEAGPAEDSRVSKWPIPPSNGEVESL